MLVTGGAGFIGRWLVKRLIDEGHLVLALDNLANGRRENLAEFADHPQFGGLTVGDIRDRELLEAMFADGRYDVCYHLGASINVQDSIDDPASTFANDAIGTFHVLDCCRRHTVKLVYTSTCMVYDRATGDAGIDEAHPVKPASPYAGAKLSGEHMVLSYWHAYRLPVVVCRPFNTYGPFQKTGGEGGVVAVFLQNKLTGADLQIYGDGRQTRDLLYVEDCARFLAMCGQSDKVNGCVVNAGLGRDIPVRQLAEILLAGNTSRIRHVQHIHPQSEIPRLLCNASLANGLLGWRPEVTLEEGLARTETWIARQLAEAAL